MNALLEEMRQDEWCKGRRVSTIYVGGGTPSLVKVDSLEFIFESLYKMFAVVEDTEITLEVHPVDVKRDNVRHWREMGINRVSVGIESMSDRILKSLGRINTSKINVMALDRLFEGGFDNVSVDIMYGVGESRDEIDHTLEQTFIFPVKHVSCYLLTVKKGTVLDELVESGRVSLPDDDMVSDVYLYLTGVLRDMGFAQYEISNFSLPKYESRHNSAYWMGYEYRGFGVSASSFVGGVRFKNTDSLDSYLSSLEHDKSPASCFEYSLKEYRMREIFVLMLRTTQGVDVESFGERFGINIEDYYGDKLEKMVRLGFIKKEEGRIKLTSPQAMFVSNWIFSEFI